MSWMFPGGSSRFRFPFGAAHAERGDLDQVAVRLLSLDLGGRQIRKALA